MDFWNDEAICGYPIARIKRLLRIGLNRFITVESAIQKLRLSRKDATELMLQLQRLGYLASQRDRDNFFQLAARGERLARTEVKRPLSLETIATFQAQLTERIEHVNAQEKFLHRIIKHAFGTESLAASGTVKYLLLGIVLSRKEEDYEKYSALSREHVSKSGIRFSNYVQELAYPEVEVEEFLRAGLYGVRVLRIEAKEWKNDKPLTMFSRWN